MRVALISNTLPPEGSGGAEAYVAALARSLRDRHQVTLLSGAASGGVEGVEHVALPGMPPVDEDDPALTKTLWHLRDQWRLEVHRTLRAALDRLRPDVVHTHEPQGLSGAVFTAVAASGVPHVHTAHDSNVICMRTSLTRDGAYCGARCRDCALQRAVRGHLLGRHVTRFIAVSEFIRRHHVEAGIVDEASSETLYLAAEPGEARLRRPEPGALRLGFIGTLAAHKGVPTLLAAFRDAPAGWRLAIAGAGPLAATVQATAGADPRISFAGPVQGAAKEAFFDGIDVLVIPSEWEEPGATVCFEAAVRGIPAVVSDRGGLPELPQVTVFRSRDAAALRSALDALGEDPARVERLSGRLLEANHEFLWSTHVGRVERILEAAAATRR